MAPTAEEVWWAGNTSLYLKVNSTTANKLVGAGFCILVADATRETGKMETTMAMGSDSTQLEPLLRLDGIRIL